MSNPNPNVANLTPMKPGETLNPNGRPKGSLNMSTRIRKILDSNIDWDKINVTPETLERLKKRYGVLALADALILVQASKAMVGDTPAFNALREAGWGRMVNVDAEVKMEVVHILAPEKLALAQIEEAAKRLRDRAQRAVEAEIIEDELDSSTRTTDIRPTNT